METAQKLPLVKALRRMHWALTRRPVEADVTRPNLEVVVVVVLFERNGQAGHSQIRDPTPHKLGQAALETAGAFRSRTCCCWLLLLLLLFCCCCWLLLLLLLLFCCWLLLLFCQLLELS